MKKFITPNELNDDSFKLANMVIKSGFKPTYIIALWRGGCPTGAIVQECYSYIGIKTDHIAIRTKTISDFSNSNVKFDRESVKKIEVYNLGYLLERLTHDDSILIVDDVFDSGLTINEVISKLKEKTKRNFPHECRTAVLYYKPKKSKVSIVPNYYLHETDQWLVFPHEMVGLTRDEIKLHRSDFYDITK